MSEDKSNDGFKGANDNDAGGFKKGDLSNGFSRAVGKAYETQTKHVNKPIGAVGKTFEDKVKIPEDTSDRKPQKNAQGDVINPKTGLPVINWEAHKKTF